MNSTEHLISIVVPVYNVEKYLRRCIDSILAQTYRNFELILVNDGSPDNSPQICDEYATSFPNIMVIHQKNGGVSVARNSGIEAATGQFLTFVDGDDFVHENLLEVLKYNIDKHKVMLSMCSYIRVNNFSTAKTLFLEKKENVKIIEPLEAMNMLIDDQTTCVPWGKLYDKQLFQDIRYPVGKIMEDMFIAPVIFQKAKQIVLDSRPLYFYNQEGISITRSDFNFKKLDMIEAASFWKEFSEKHYPELSEKATNHYYAIVISMCQSLAKSTTKLGKSNYSVLKKEIFENFNLIFNSKYTTKNNKIKLILLKLGLFGIFFKLKK